MEIKNYCAFVAQRETELTKSLFHDLSNKLNLISLPLEDLEDCLESEGELDKSEIKELVGELNAGKKKSLSLLTEQKGFFSWNSSDQEKISKEELKKFFFNLSQKKWQKLQFHAELDFDDKAVKKGPALRLLWNIFALHEIFLVGDKKAHVEFRGFEVQCPKEAELLKTFGQAFEVSYKEEKAFLQGML